MFCRVSLLLDELNEDLGWKTHQLDYWLSRVTSFWTRLESNLGYSWDNGLKNQPSPSRLGLGPSLVKLRSEFESESESGFSVFIHFLSFFKLMPSISH